MFTQREAQILEILRNRHVVFAKEGQAMNVSVYLDYYWDELTALSVVAPEYVAYIPPNPKGNPMYETGKHMTLPAIENFDYVPYKQTLAAEPAHDSAIEEIPCVLEDKNTRIAELEAQLNAMEVDRDDWKQSCISANRRFEANDEATKEAFELRKQVAKLQVENAAYEAIVLQAGQDFAVLKAENARYRTGLKRLIAKMDETLRGGVNWGDYNNARNQANDILVVVDFAAVETPTPQAPKSSVPATVSVDWNGRGYSSGKYPVLAHSQAGKYFVLDISTDPAVTMPKRVSFADCAV